MKLIRWIIGLSLAIAAFYVLPPHLFWKCVWVGAGVGAVASVLLGMVEAIKEDESVRMGVLAGLIASPLVALVGALLALQVGAGVYIALPYLGVEVG